MKTLKNFTEYNILISSLNKHLDEVHVHYQMGLITFQEKIDLTVELSLRIYDLLNESNDHYPDETKKNF